MFKSISTSVANGVLVLLFTTSDMLYMEIVKVDAELNMIVIRGAIPGPKGGLVYIRNTVKNNKIKQAGADISKNPQKASGRNPQKASARG